MQLYRGVVAGVNYSAQQHVEKKVPSVAKYVHAYACEHMRDIFLL